MKKTFLLFLFTTIYFVAFSQTAQLPVTVVPIDATSDQEITLTLFGNLSCPANAVDSMPSILMHSGYTIEVGTGWQGVVDAMVGDSVANTGADGTPTVLESNGDTSFSITFTPDLYYDTINIIAINCVFNAGLHTDGQWDAEAKAFAADSSCTDITIPIPFSGVGVRILYRGIDKVNVYPNPFVESTTIKYSLDESQKVTVSIYNTLGQTVENLVNAVQKAGEYEVFFNGSELSNGLYLYRIETNKVTKSGRLIKE
ncbi:MAG: T9SS type A sorting domain-containing protein [Bacteroidales bacterium]|nr:T9SS type A sorting domain-containing protein [Bacteroidales bacterium]